MTIRSGAGGDDATDFAEMLCGCICAGRRSTAVPTKVIDTSYAEGAGIKSATFEIDAPYAFGTLSSKPARTASPGSVPSAPPTSGRRASPVSRSIPLLEEATSVEIPETDIRVDVYPLLRARRPVREHDRLRSPADPHPDRDCGVDAEREVADPEPCRSNAGAPRRACSCCSVSRKPRRKRSSREALPRAGATRCVYFLYGQQLVKDLRTGFESTQPRRGVRRGDRWFHCRRHPVALTQKAKDAQRFRRYRSRVSARLQASLGRGA